LLVDVAGVGSMAIQARSPPRRHRRRRMGLRNRRGRIATAAPICGRSSMPF